MVTPSSSSDSDGSTDPGPDGMERSRWSVGEVSTSLGIPVSTLRTWDHRHGIGPPVRVQGRHRRYDARDVEDVRRFAALVGAGLAPAAAGPAVTVARDVADQHAHELFERGDQPGDAFSTLAAAAVRSIVAAGVTLDQETMAGVAHAMLNAHPVELVWSRVLVPSLTIVGDLWHRGDIGIEVEHVMSEVVSSALRARAATALASAPDPAGAVGTVVLASVDHHHLPLLALQLALAHRGVESIQLGPRLPVATFYDVVSRVDVDRYFVWASLVPADPEGILGSVARRGGRGHLVLGGPGWSVPNVSFEPPVRLTQVYSLEDAVTALTA